MKRVLARTDAAISEWSEDLARRVSRRHVLTRAAKRGAAIAAGLSMGSLVGTRAALAATCCSYPGCGHCSCRGLSCPSNGCPSACVVCKSTSGCSQCPHGDGNWTCGSCGVCGFGYFRCWDCRCTSCSQKCGCTSTCQCSGCCSAGDVKKEMAKARREVARIAAGTGAPV